MVALPQEPQQWGLDLALPEVAGFRLWNLELLNWGTFDGDIHTFAIEGRDTFITGNVGAGKSTIVDALTTLFVPTGKLVYNKAAGADRGERKLDTYLRGTYSTQADDAGASSKPVSLRSTAHVSAILAHFHRRHVRAGLLFHRQRNRRQGLRSCGQAGHRRGLACWRQVRHTSAQRHDPQPHDRARDLEGVHRRCP